MQQEKDRTDARQAEWVRHSRDEEHAIRGQQASAGPSHEPVGDPWAARHERQRCAEVVRRWLDPQVIAALTGPLADDAVKAVREVLGAIADELVRDELPEYQARVHAVPGRST